MAIPASGGRPEAPSAINRLAETLGIVAAGFVVGGIAFVLFVWILGRFGGADRSEDSIAPARPPRAEDHARGGASQVRPAWLDTATAPRARLAPERVAASPRQNRLVAEGSDPASRQTTAEGSDPPPAPGPQPTAAQRIQVESIDYDDDPARRRVTLRLGTGLVTLQQRQSAHGLEVQLIQPDGAYVRRGGDVFLVTPAR